MKYYIKNKIMCLLIIFLLMLGTIPCQAMPHTPPKQVASMEELLEWYGALSDDANSTCGVTAPIVCKGEVILTETPCQADISFIGGLRIPSDAWLTIDNPNLVLMGPPPTITVEAGGVLHLRRWNALSAQAMPPGGIVIQSGGRLLIDSGIILPEGLVIDNNPPPNTILPPKPETPVPEEPDNTLPTEEKLFAKGEVLKVTEQGMLYARLTLLRVEPTQTVTIERSADEKEWKTEYIFNYDESYKDFRTDNKSEFGALVSRTRYDGSKTDFQYLARLSGNEFYLRVILTYEDGKQTVSDAIKLTEPPVGQYPGSEDYEDSEGNRGGTGQGTTDREEQKEDASANTTAPAEPPKPPTEPPSEKTPPVSAAELQEVNSIAQSTSEKQADNSEKETALPINAKAPEQSEEPLPQSAPPTGFARNWVILAATLVLCGAIWIFIKKKS